MLLAWRSQKAAVHFSVHPVRGHMMPTYFSFGVYNFDRLVKVISAGPFIVIIIFIFPFAIRKHL